MMEGPGADSEEKHEPVSDIDTAVVVVGLKALDPEWPIREAIGGIADMPGELTHGSKGANGPEGDIGCRPGTFLPAPHSRPSI